MSGRAEPWRRTGRKAGEEHFLGLEKGAVVEAAAFDDAGKQQGSLLFILSRETEDTHGIGQTWWVQFLGISDAYYEHWLEERHGKITDIHEVPVHFCDRKSVACSVRSKFRDVIQCTASVISFTYLLIWSI